MIRTTIPFAATRQFSDLVDDYLSSSDKLKPFYRFSPDPASFEDALLQRKGHPVNREVLSDILLKQYDGLIHTDDTVYKNIVLLKDQNTFTVTTGHQLNILTGPLYFIYKIATTIRLAEELKKKFPDHHFVPVYWMASEDHDFEEIRSARVFGQQVTWQTEQKGAVGRFSTDGMEELIKELKSIIGNRYQLPDIIEKAYINATSLADATRTLVHHLFGNYGLVILDGDNSALKRLFIPEFKNELISSLSFEAVNRTNEKFSNDYKVQVTPREINLFYLKNGIRERIIRQNDGIYSVNNSELRYNLDELLNELEHHPERFSPNVILRPVYQERILPNLAYIGGPGELNYWLQLMTAFDAFKTPFPVLMLRNCMLLLNGNIRKRMDKLSITTTELFESTEYLTLKVLEGASDVHFGTEKQAAQIQKAFDELSSVYHKLDPTLTNSVDAEKQKILNSLSNLEDKARRILKKKNETLVSQVKMLKEQLMPGGSLQERSDNILSYCNGDLHSFISMIISHTDPFTKEFQVLEDEQIL